MMLNENVKKVFLENTWSIATCSDGEPNVVPVGFKNVTDDGKLVVGDVFLKTTMENIQSGSNKIAVSAYDAKTSEGYQIKGTAEYVSEGEIVDTFKAMADQLFQGKMSAKGALIIKPEKVIVTTPGPDNKKIL